MRILNFGSLNWDKTYRVPHFVLDIPYEQTEESVRDVAAQLREMKRFRIPLLSQTIDDGSSRIAQSHYFGAFVEGFSGGVVDRRADDLHFQRRHDAHDLRMASADQQA